MITQMYIMLMKFQVIETNGFHKNEDIKIN